MRSTATFALPLLSALAVSAVGVDSSVSVRLSPGVVPGFTDNHYKFTDGSSSRSSVSPEPGFGLMLGGRLCLFASEEKSVGLIAGVDAIYANQRARWEKEFSGSGHSIETQSVNNLGAQAVLGIALRVNAKTRVEWTIEGGGGAALSPKHHGDYTGYTSGNGSFDYALKDGSFYTYGSAIGAFYRLAKSLELGVVFDYSVFQADMDAEDSYVASDNVKSETWWGQGLGAHISVGFQF